MTAAERYVAAAYLIVVVVVLGYVLIIATKLQRLERAVTDLSSGPDVEPALEEPALAAASNRGGRIEARAR